MHILQFMLNKDRRLISKHKLQQIPQKLIVCLIAVLMGIPHFLVLTHMANKIKVYQSHLITPHTPLPKTRKVEIAQPCSILVEGRYRCDYLFKGRD